MATNGSTLDSLKGVTIVVADTGDFAGQSDISILVLFMHTNSTN